MTGRDLWRVERDGAELHIFAVRPALPIAWSAPRAEAVLDRSAEFWHETPEVTPETQALAMKAGIDPACPLETFLPTVLRARLDAVASELDVPAALLAAMRPWLAVQTLRLVAESRRGLDRAAAPEAVIRTRAKQAGIPIKTEFPSVTAVMEFFARLPAQAEVEMLSIELDDLEAGPSGDLRRAELWLHGDLSYEEELASGVARRYPAFYEHLARARNVAWVPRIEGLLGAGTRAFITVGMGHMVGPDSIPEKLWGAGITIERVLRRA